MYPFEKYRYYTAGNKIIAVSTYAGKTVRGIAKCAEGDTFNMEKGKQLAALRCAQRIAEKRIDRAHGKLELAKEAETRAVAHVDKMWDYYTDACEELDEIEDAIGELLEEM